MSEKQSATNQLPSNNLTAEDSQPAVRGNDSCIEIIDMDIASNSSDSKPSSPAAPPSGDIHPMIMQIDNSLITSSAASTVDVKPKQGFNVYNKPVNNTKLRSGGDDYIAEVITLNDTMEDDEGIVIISGSSSEEKVKLGSAASKLSPTSSM